MAASADGLAASGREREHHWRSEDTPFFWTPGAYQRIRMDIDTIARTWAFFVNDVRYNAPDPLGYPGLADLLGHGRLLSGINAPNGVRIDAVTIGPAVPQP